MSNTIIIAVRYEEPEWDYTWKCLVSCGVPIIVIGREGIGSLSGAYNKAFKENLEIIRQYKYVWFVSNITFNKDALKTLVNGMEVSGFAALHPSFKSDHKHLRPLNQNIVKEELFIEFTSPIIKTDVFEEFRLDEDMPFTGHDLDWGYRVRQSGYKIGVHHGAEVGHTYIRNNRTPHKVTEMRKSMRNLWKGHTENKLIAKYGKDWKSVLGYKYSI